MIADNNRAIIDGVLQITTSLSENLEYLHDHSKSETEKQEAMQSIRGELESIFEEASLVTGDSEIFDSMRAFLQNLLRPFEWYIYETSIPKPVAEEIINLLEFFRVCFERKLYDEEDTASHIDPS